MGAPPAAVSAFTANAAAAPNSRNCLLDRSAMPSTINKPGQEKSALTLCKQAGQLVYERNANLLFDAETSSLNPFSNPSFGQRKCGGELDRRRTALVFGIKTERQIITGQ